MAVPATSRRTLSTLPPDQLVRWALGADAAVTGVNGLAYLVGAGLLDGPLGVPATLLRPVGAFLLGFAGVVWFIATRPVLHPVAVRVVIALNVLWALDSVVALTAGWLTPTTVGAVWTVLQAGTVIGFAGLQRWALGRENGPDAPGRGTGPGGHQAAVRPSRAG